MLNDILKNLTLATDNIYEYRFDNQSQTQEIALRKQAAGRTYDNYLDEIAMHHSIPVMDREVRLFLKQIPKDGIVIDVGGCWGWHWRSIDKIRPDVRIVIVEFIRESLMHAKAILGPLVNKNVFLVHGDACSLIFDNNTFDAYWTVQALQHIPNFNQAVKEAHRVLKPGGIFVNYSYNSASIIKICLSLLGRTYHSQGEIPGLYYLSKASDEQRKFVEDIFQQPIKRRYSEIFYRPGMGIIFPAKERSLVGKVDSWLSGSNVILSWIARQQSYHTRKT